MDFKKESDDEILVTKQKGNKVSMAVLLTLALGIMAMFGFTLYLLVKPWLGFKNLDKFLLVQLVSCSMIGSAVLVPLMGPLVAGRRIIMSLLVALTAVLVLASTLAAKFQLIAEPSSTTSFFIVEGCLLFLGLLLLFPLLFTQSKFYRCIVPVNEDGE